MIVVNNDMVLCNDVTLAEPKLKFDLFSIINRCACEICS